MGKVGKRIGNVVTAPITQPIAMVKGLSQGGIKGALAASIDNFTGSTGLFGQTSRGLSEKLGLNDSGSNIPDPGSPPPLLDPRSAEYAFDEYQKKYAGKLPASAIAEQQIAGIRAAQATDAGIRGAAGGAATAMSSLARKGGLSQGAMERVARGNAYDALMARQQGAQMGAEMGQQAAVRGLQQSEQDARNMANAYMQLLQQNQNMMNQIYGANKGAQIIASQPPPRGLFGGTGFLGLGL